MRTCWIFVPWFGHMYFLNPRPGATSLKHCRQKFSPYFLTMGPYWPHRLHGRAPFPYFLTFLGLILAMVISASHLGCVVLCHKLDSFHSGHVVVVPYLCGSNRVSSNSEAWTPDTHVNRHAKYSKFGHLFR